MEYLLSYDDKNGEPITITDFPQDGPPKGLKVYHSGNLYETLRLPLNDSSYMHKLIEQAEFLAQGRAPVEKLVETLDVFLDDSER